MSEERINDLEARFVWLERQAVERDHEIMALADRLRRLERQFEKMSAKLDQGPEVPMLPIEEEKPPHY